MAFHHWHTINQICSCNLFRIFVAIAAVDDIVVHLTDHSGRTTMVMPVVKVSDKLTLLNTHQTRPAVPNALSHCTTSDLRHFKMICLALGSDPSKWHVQKDILN